MLLFVGVIFFLRLNLLTSNVQAYFLLSLGRFFLGQTVFFLFFTLMVLNSLFNIYQNLLCLCLGDFNDIILSLDYFTFIDLNSLSLNLLDVYLYPFIYVFVLITALSIVFCLSYNKDESLTFMFYCQVILFSGYLLFFTNSLIIFFFAYEMLLVPSFFILYKFAKTRRCVEAAYLMFF